MGKIRENCGLVHITFYTKQICKQKKNRCLAVLAPVITGAAPVSSATWCCPAVALVHGASVAPLPRLWKEGSGHAEPRVRAQSSLLCFWTLNMGRGVPSWCFPLLHSHPNCKCPITNTCSCRRHVQKKTQIFLFGPRFQASCQSPSDLFNPAPCWSFKEQLLQPCRLCSHCAVEDLM